MNCGSDFTDGRFDGQATPLAPDQYLPSERRDGSFSIVTEDEDGVMRRAPGTKEHLDLIAPTHALLERSGKPYCIENVVGAPLIHPTTLRGSMFGLQAPEGAELRRHRLFETSFSLAAPSACRHGSGSVIGVYGAHVRDRRRPAGRNHCSGSNRPWAHAFVAMAVPLGSMTLAELSEAIPPAYSRFVVEAFLKNQARQMAGE